MMKSQKHNNLGSLVKAVAVAIPLLLGTGKGVTAQSTSDYKSGIAEFVVESEKEISIPASLSYVRGPPSIYDKEIPADIHVDILRGYPVGYPDKKMNLAYMGDNFWTEGDTVKIQFYMHKDGLESFTAKELVNKFKTSHPSGMDYFSNDSETTYPVRAVATKRLE